MKNARRDQVQHDLPAAGEDRVPRIVTALIARDDVEMRRQQIDDFSLAFIAPLGSEHAEIHAASMIPSGPSNLKRHAFALVNH